MNAAEQLEVIKLLHAVGATHFKSHDFEIDLNAAKKQAYLTNPAQIDGTAPGQVNGYQTIMQPSPVPENTEATEKLKDLIKTMSLSPEQLVDVVFPAGAGG
jgi:hypothetical protein